jgi:hypothetical protein
MWMVDHRISPNVGGRPQGLSECVSRALDSVRIRMMGSRANLNVAPGLIWIGMVGARASLDVMGKKLILVSADNTTLSSNT